MLWTRTRRAASNLYEDNWNCGDLRFAIESFSLCYQLLLNNQFLFLDLFSRERALS